MSEDVSQDGGGVMMTILGHLNELKDHLIRIALALVVCSAIGLVFTTRVLTLLLVPVAGLSLCLFAYEKRRIYPGMALEALVESNLLLAGLLALAWQAI